MQDGDALISRIVVAVTDNRDEQRKLVNVRDCIRRRLKACVLARGGN